MVQAPEHIAKTAEGEVAGVVVGIPAPLGWYQVRFVVSWGSRAPKSSFKAVDFCKVKLFQAREQNGNICQHNHI